jgi:hypothetical protein
MSTNRKYLAFIALPAEIMVLELGFFFAGRWLDKTYNWAPIGEILGPLIGFGIWIFHLTIMIRAVSSEKPSEE